VTKKKSFLRLIPGGGLKVANKFSKVVVLRVLSAVVVRLKGLDDGGSLEANGLQLGDLGDGEALQGAVDEGGNLLGRLKPGAHGDLLDLGHGRLGPRDDRDGGNPDQGVFGGVVDDGEQDGLDQDGVQPGDALQRVDSDRPDHGRGGDAAVDDLDEGAKSVDVAELAEGGNGHQAVLLLLVLPLGRGLNLGFEVRDPLLGDDLGLVGAEVSVDADGEFSHPANGVDASAVHQPAHVDEAKVGQILDAEVEDLLLGPFQVPDVLDQLNQLLENLLGRGLDGPESSFEGVDGQAASDLATLDVLLDQHHGRVGSSSAQGTIEETPGINV